MISDAHQNPVNAFAQFALRWFGLLSQGRFDEAASLIDAPNTYGMRWGAQQIQQVLLDYAGGARIPSVTDPHQLGDSGPRSVGEGRHWILGKFDDGSGFWLDHDLPLDGRWSDLTAQFEFHKVPGGFSVVLHDIHVL